MALALHVPDDGLDGRAASEYNMGTHHHLYTKSHDVLNPAHVPLKRWLKVRKHQLQEHPLCAFCAERGLVVPATICDHVEPHHGDERKFWEGRLQSLCASCHSGIDASYAPQVSPCALAGMVAHEAVRNKARADAIA